ncbi:hypothetical protein ABID26_003757 [Mesorhizobium shonense]|uniref:Propionyl-coenzyme A carboxylase alpha polypeptide n=1 Tax=Mesorhizobium shonense TaxID=1209948 RepID=A0ABV2HUQ9_9HYPH
MTVAALSFPPNGSGERQQSPTMIARVSGKGSI